MKRQSFCSFLFLTHQTHEDVLVSGSQTSNSLRGRDKGHWRGGREFKSLDSLKTLNPPLSNHLFGRVSYWLKLGLSLIHNTTVKSSPINRLFIVQGWISPIDITTATPDECVVLDLVMFYIYIPHSNCAYIL